MIQILKEYSKKEIEKKGKKVPATPVWQNGIGLVRGQTAYMHCWDTQRSDKRQTRPSAGGMSFESCHSPQLSM